MGVQPIWHWTDSNKLPGDFSFPAVGRLGLTSPPYRSGLFLPPELRYYDQLRLPNDFPGFVRFWLSAPGTLFALHFSVSGLSGHEQRNLMIPFAFNFNPDEERW